MNNDCLKNYFFSIFILIYNMTKPGYAHIELYNKSGQL